ncbi:hypothetical protein SCG7086_AC_00430 [Chlamydiales bacterium SCGC AG-110-P3]|nr:hypothetical protein SCG7086_AC_00430 [Chlamydiales bacterium SCGC AG-110-P3]
MQPTQPIPPYQSKLPSQQEVAGIQNLHDQVEAISNGNAKHSIHWLRGREISYINGMLIGGGGKVENLYETVNLNALNRKFLRLFAGNEQEASYILDSSSSFFRESFASGRIRAPIEYKEKETLRATYIMLKNLQEASNTELARKGIVERVFIAIGWFFSGIKSYSSIYLNRESGTASLQFNAVVSSPIPRNNERTIEALNLAGRFSVKERSHEDLEHLDLFRREDPIGIQADNRAPSKFQLLDALMKDQRERKNTENPMTDDEHDRRWHEIATFGTDTGFKGG